MSIKSLENVLSQNNLVDLILNGISEGISILDRDLNILYTNSTMREWYRENLPLEGKKCYQAYHDRDARCQVCPSSRAMESGEKESDVVPGLPDSKVEWLELTAYPMNINGTGKPDIVVEFVRDITEAKRSRQELEKTKEQLHQAQKMEALGRLAGGVAHDFNNMLTVILGYTEAVLSSLNKDNPIYNDLEEVAKAAKRSAELTSRLLAFSRKQPMHTEPVDLGERLFDMEKLLKRMLGEKIDLSITARQDLWPVKMDPVQFEHVIANLVVNSRDAMPDARGRIDISAFNRVIGEDELLDLPPDAGAGEYVTIKVEDNGAGMDEEALKHAMEPFFTTKPVGQGTGLGLSTVYGMVTQLGGFVEIRSRPGKGTSVEINLPRCSVRSIDGAGEQRKPSAVFDEAGAVLLVEDEDTVRKMLEKMLKKLGFNVVSAPDLSSAKNLLDAKGTNICLLMTDIVLPDGNGKDLAKYAADALPSLKVLFISGYPSMSMRLHLDDTMQGDRYDFLHKPFTMTSLSKSLQKLLS